VLIQLGGLGVMTFWLLAFWLLRGRVSLASRSVFEHTVSSMAGRRFGPVLRLVFLFTLITEGIGALLLAARFYPQMGFGKALWYGLFHAVSAFCNAGFALFPDSLVGFAGDVGVNTVVMALILLGGFGFFTVYDFTTWLRRRQPLTVHSRIALLVSGVLVLAGAGSFWLIESGRSLAGMGPTEQVLASLFQSVTTRTAGFNSVDLTELAPATLFVMILLMFIGGSSGSCAGGVKTTTLGVLLLAAAARFRGHVHVNVFRRTLSANTVNGALAIAAGGVVTVMVGLFALLLAEGPVHTVEQEHAIFLNYFFETVSALGTVGLSLGTTPELSTAGRIVVAMLMFIGRLGPLTVTVALAVPRPERDWKYPEEEVMVG